MVNRCYNTIIDQVVSRKERSAMDVISSEKLTKYYGKNRGIIDLSLDVKQGEIFGVIGPNGAGKSTTIKLLLDFIRPTMGRCSIFGLDCTRASADIKKDIGYIPADVNYYDGMSVGELLEYSAGYYKSDFKKHGDMLCDALELDASRKITELSTGNKKKVAIAQAMLHKPKLLIMDEPTSGLDPLMQHVFYGLLKEAKDEGATIFFSSHILSEVQRVCDRVGIIRDGRLINTQTMEELKATEYKRVKATTDADINIPGAEHIKRLGGTIEFLYKGPADKLISALAGHRLSNILIEDPPLEDIFMAYYQEGGK